jgi:hypothetical protein
MLDKIPPTPSAARDAFRLARTNLGWDELLQKSLHDGLGLAGLHGLVESFIQGAFPKLASTGIVGALTSKTGAGFASFEVSQFGGLSPSEIGPTSFGGIGAPILVTWNAAPGDQVLFGGDPSWPLSRLAGALALEPARAHASTATTVPEALAQTLSCAKVATILVQDANAVTTYAECNAACMQRLCEGALNLMWTRAAYTPDDPTLVDFAATGAATVADDAKPASFVGTWVGSLRVGTTTGKMGGAATGKP